MGDDQLEKFLKGDNAVISQLKSLITEYIAKTGGTPDDAREIFQMVSLNLFEMHARSLSYLLIREYKRQAGTAKMPAIADVRRLEAVLDASFPANGTLKNLLREGNSEAHDFFTNTVQKIFGAFVPNMSLSEEDTCHIIARVHEKIQPRIQDFQDYFLKSCRNEWIRLKKKRAMIRLEDESTLVHIADGEEYLPAELSNVILNLLHTTSEGCRRLLHHFFVEGKTKRELLELLSYSNAGSFDVAKSRCLSALRDKAKQHAYFRSKSIWQL